MDNAVLSKLKRILREDEIPFFTDEELNEYYEENGLDLKRTIFCCCIVKAENTEVQVSGLSLGDTSNYFLRLARQYRPNNSGTLKGF